MTSPSSRSTRITALVLALVAVALYAPVVGWGVPYATAADRAKTFATDEILPLEALAEMHNTFVVSKADRNYGYPWWHYFVVSVAQAPYLASLAVAGELANPAPTYPFGFRDPVRSLQVLTIIGRLVSVVMGAGIVVASFFFARALWDESTGTIAAVLTLLNYLMFYYSRTGNLDVPAFFWSAIGLAILATILADKLTSRRAAWLGLSAGLAIATKDQSVALFMPLALVLLLPRFNHRPNEPYQIAPLTIGVVTSIVAYVIATGMLIDPRRHITHVYSLFFDQSRVMNWDFYYPSIPHTWSGSLELLSGFLRGLSTVMSPPVLLVAAFGFVLAARADAWRAVWLLPFASIFTLLVWLTGGVYLRYLLPLTLFVDAFAASAVIRLRHSRFSLVFIPVLVLVCAWRLMMGIDLTYAQVHETRYQAADWMRQHARPGDTIEYFGVKDTLPAMSAALKSRRIMGREHWTGEFGHGPAVLEYLATRGPEFVIVIPDWTSPPGMERSADCPPEVYAALLEGRIGYRLVAHFATPSVLPGSLRRPPLDNPSVSPPVRLFARADVISSRALNPQIADPEPSGSKQAY
jgi:Dolichyl-phosphate-mannose-protein mannosyltransferase